MDLGSNDEIFWFWIKRNQPPALYFCRHDRFAASAAKQILPVDLTWLPTALGVANVRAGGTITKAHPISAGRLEIRTLPTTPTETPWSPSSTNRGESCWRNMSTIHRATGWPRAQLSRHQRDGPPASRSPGTSKLHLPTMQLQIGIGVERRGKSTACSHRKRSVSQSRRTPVTQKSIWRSEFAFGSAHRPAAPLRTLNRRQVRY